MSASTFDLAAPDGHPIFVARHDPAGAPTATVQIVHGMAEHQGRYTTFAERLAERGFVVYASDHRGHGKSVPPGEAPGHLGEDGFTHAVRVQRALHQRIHDDHPKLPHVLFGHSMGSFVVQRLIGAHPEVAHAAILSASNGKPPLLASLGRYVARLERMRLGPRGKSKLLNALSFEDFNKKFAPNRTDFDWISSDPAQVDEYIRDPLCGFMVTVQSWVDLLDALPTLTAPSHLARIRRDLPIYVLAGERDPVGDMGAGVRRLVDTYRAAGLSKVELQLYPGGRHEMLHERNASEVTSQLIAWIERTLETRPEASRATT